MDEEELFEESKIMKWELYIYEFLSVVSILNKFIIYDEFWSKFFEFFIVVLYGLDLSLCVFVWECSDGFK